GGARQARVRESVVRPLFRQVVGRRILIRQALARQALVQQVQVRRVLVHQVQVRQVLVECGGDAGGEDEALQQGVGRQPVGSVDAGAGDLAAGVEAGDGRPAVQVGADAAARVVGGRD